MVEAADTDIGLVVRPREPLRRIRPPRIDGGEEHLRAGRVAEAHLQLAVDGQQFHLVRDVGEEQDRGLAARDLRQIGIESSADRQVVGGEVQLADDQELAVGREADDHLTVEDLLRGVDREHLGAAGDEHRRGEGRQEPAQPRVRLQRPDLVQHLLTHAGEPVLRRHRRRQLEFRPAEL